MTSRSAVVLAFVSILTVLAASAPTRAADLELRGGRYGGPLGTWHHLGFWGNPFPFGYRWSLVAACREKVLVETTRGPRWKTVWACSVPHRYAGR